MKILFIHNFYRQAGGEDKVVANEMRILENGGHQVTLLAFHNDAFKRSFKTLKSLFHNQHAFQQTKDKIQQFRPDLIHVHNFFYTASTAVFKAAEEAKVPVIQTLHNYRSICISALLMRNHAPCELCVNQMIPWQGIKYQCFQGSSGKSAVLAGLIAWQKYTKAWTTRVQKVIALTSYAKHKILNSSLGIHSNQILVKANSVDDFGLSPWQHRENYLLFVGRLSSEKGIQVLLEASQHTQLNIRVIGDGPLANRVQIASENQDNLSYLGPQKHTIVMQQVKACKGLLMPSLWYEGLPNTILEAFSTGTPVLASDIDNLNQIVRNQENGLTFKMGDGKDLADKAEVLCSNQTKWSDLAKNARESYEQLYSHTINFQQLIDIYQEAIHDYQNTGIDS